MAAESDQSNPDNPTTETMPPNESQPAVEAAPADAAKEPLTKDDDNAKVKFTSGNDAKLEMGGQGKDDPYRALSKDELQKFATDPFWVRMRWAFFVLFWIAWVGMLVAAVVIIVLAPKCYSPEPKQWWQKAPMYEIYVRSFKDSDENGSGDLRGVQSKVDYLKSLGIGSVYFPPIYPATNVDDGYDIKDFKNIDPIYGSLDDFKDLVTVLNENEIKVILEFVPNHSAKEHEWFTKSVAKEEPYTDYYVWRDGNSRTPPNNWRSTSGGSAWTWNEKRGQFYLGQFGSNKPDLNVRNDAVVEELKDILKFWMDLGVDGFRMDSVTHLFEADHFDNEPTVPRMQGYAGLKHEHTFNLPEVLDLLKTLREVLDEKTKEDEYNPRIMIAEVDLPMKDLAQYYGTNFTAHAGDIAHLPVNYNFSKSFQQPGDVTADKVQSTIQRYLASLPASGWPNFHFGDHESSRVASRVGREFADALRVVTMLLPGTPITYYGEEIGMVDYDAGSLKTRPRSPMQWNGGSKGGFTSGGNTWIPVNQDFKEVNVAKQEEEPNSRLKVYRALSELRHEPSVLFGTTDMMVNGTLFAYRRVRKGTPGYLVAANFGDQVFNADVSRLTLLPGNGKVVVKSFSQAAEEAGQEGEEKVVVDSEVDLTNLPVGPKEAIVVQFVPDMKDVKTDEEKEAEE